MDKKQYSNSFHTLEAIWQVLQRYSSRQHPLTVREIHEYLRRLESEPPALSTLERSLREGIDLMELLFPGQAVPAAGGGHAVTAYQEGGAVHVVVENPEGEPLDKGASAVEASVPPFRAPSYSAIDKLLKEGVPFDLGTFPYRLRCVARVPGGDGRPKVIPYDEWEVQLERQGTQRNNVPRRYYLSSELTDGEWRLFADLVRVYPYISERQTQKFLRVLNRLNPKTPRTVPSRYAFKRGSADRMRIIGKLDRAVAEKRKVRVSYGEYRLVCRDGIWTPELRLREQNSQWELEPYALMWANGNYYLVAKNRGIMNLRTDRILDVELLDEKFDIPEDFDPVRHRDSSPVMYPGEKTFVRLRCREEFHQAGWDIEVKIQNEQETSSYYLEVKTHTRWSKTRSLLPLSDTQMRQAADLGEHYILLLVIYDEALDQAAAIHPFQNVIGHLADGSLRGTEGRYILQWANSPKL